MLAFLETDLKVDASGLSIGSGATISIPLTIDQRSTPAALASFTVSVPNNSDTTVPFGISIVKTNTKICTLTVTFNQPLANVHFGDVRAITITGADSSTYSLNLEIDNAVPYADVNWTNSADSLSIADFNLRAPLTSLSLNNVLRPLFQAVITSLNQARLFIKFYAYKYKYLTDIIDFAIAAGSSFEPSTGTVTFNTDGSIATILTAYSNSNRPRTQNIKITYTYSSYTLNRLQLRSGSYSILTTETVSLLSSFSIDAVDGSGNVIYNLGVVTVNRSSSPTVYAVPYLLDYNPSLSSDTVATDPGNILSDYKYYQTNTIIGWTVSA